MLPALFQEALRPLKSRHRSARPDLVDPLVVMHLGIACHTSAITIQHSCPVHSAVHDDTLTCSERGAISATYVTEVEKWQSSRRQAPQ